MFATDRKFDQCPGRWIGGMAMGLLLWWCTAAAAQVAPPPAPPAGDHATAVVAADSAPAADKERPPSPAAALQPPGNLLPSIWNLQIGESLTLGVLVLTVAGLAIALILANLISRLVFHSLIRRFRVGESRAHLLGKLAFYFLGLVLVLTTLQWLQIPLTVFAFLGGALMVGIGFGSQNLMNNFISGLILLLEQKVHVGDLVEVQGNLGRITNLGSRCATIKKFDGVEVLVPNSALLEKDVVNWTLSDPQHRFDFTVGVAYGSPLERVIEVLKQSMTAQPEVLQEPAPAVFFEEFGDSTLNFRLFYWLEIGTCDGRQVGSEIRMRIDRLCREHNIEIAFPQRDVHLRVPTPIPVRIQDRQL